MFFLIALPLVGAAVVVKGAWMLLSVVLTAIGFTKSGVAAGQSSPMAQYKHRATI